MDDKIKITKDLKFDYNDLMKNVDVSQEFTMRDILTICVNSKIPMLILGQILQCRYINDYYDESKKKPSDEENHMNYLELYWWGSKSCYDNIREDGNFWSFHGVGKKGYVPDDLLEYGGLTEEEKKDFIQYMAVEFTPMYDLANFTVKISKQLQITDYEADVNKMDNTIDFQPTITLIELLYWIFWELSFFGSTSERDEKAKELSDMVKDIDSGKMKTYSSEEVFGRLNEKIEEVKNRRDKNGL